LVLFELASVRHAASHDQVINVPDLAEDVLHSKLISSPETVENSVGRGLFLRVHRIPRDEVTKPVDPSGKIGADQMEGVVCMAKPREVAQFPQIGRVIEVGDGVWVISRVVSPLKQAHDGKRRAVLQLHNVKLRVRPAFGCS
jgi:hypothetical protein